MFIARALGPIMQNSKKSILLLGPRQTGKSTLIKSLVPSLSINLADEQTYLSFASNPAELTERLKAKQYESVFIDEIQRLPSLLNTIQAILDENNLAVKFYLTGSSARKLKRGKANLLPGRIHTYQLGGFACSEMGYHLNTKQTLSTGTLPGIYTDPSPEEQKKTLKSYSATYLKEEIQAEALTRNIEGFSRFLFVTAFCSGTFLDISKLASEAQISRQSAIRFFEILEDTLIVNRCDAFSKSGRKRLIQHPKFYFFDNGVLNALMDNFEVSPDRKGILFEHFFFNQLLASAHAKDKEIKIATYRTEHGAEVDFIVEVNKKVWAIELKASENIAKVEKRGFESFSQFYKKPHQRALAYLGETEKRVDDIFISPWQKIICEMGL